jgi:uncharacterized protein YndB with AHSA1/START domain
MPDIHQSLLIGAAIEEVYTAVTDQGKLSAWWTPNTRATATVNSVARFPFGNSYFKEMKITALRPFELVKWHCIQGTDEWIDTDLSFQLMVADKRTLANSHPEMGGQAEQQQDDAFTVLIFQHNNWKAYTPMFAECSFTWGRFLRSLKLLCETGQGKPWPQQHSIG